MICDDTNRNEELAHMKDTFRRNGYPERVVTSNLRSQRNSMPQTEEEPLTTERPKLLYLPYLQGTSEDSESMQEDWSASCLQVKWYSLTTIDESEESRLGDEEERCCIHNPVPGLWLPVHRRD